MTEVRESCEFGVPAPHVWSLVADFAGFAEMLVASRNGNVQISGAGVGMTRAVRVDGQFLLERLEEIDEDNFQTRYSMLVTGPFPIRLPGDHCANCNFRQPMRIAVDRVLRPP
jgi:hypothetical protein